MSLNVHLAFLVVIGLLLSKKLEGSEVKTQLNYTDFNLDSMKKTEIRLLWLPQSHSNFTNNITIGETNKNNNTESTVEHDSYFIDFLASTVNEIKTIPFSIINKTKSIITPYLFIFGKGTFNESNNSTLKNSNYTDSIYGSSIADSSINSSDVNIDFTNKTYKIKNERVFPFLRGGVANGEDLSNKFKNDSLFETNFSNNTDRLKNYLTVDYNESYLNENEKNKLIGKVVTNRSLQFTSLFGFGDFGILGLANGLLFPDVGADPSFDLVEIPASEWDTTEFNYGDENLEN
ncbi:hypothetical protein FG379_001718 [Cryptosporidium bovis]|uniref:uncharacterized protein n=1 Tax=Cryptosporidium bovis TaxID=310047 RepID=UPI00351A9F80|nr:hypothetical protein FG379_001718 [Cryptosporidium bovis]